MSVLNKNLLYPAYKQVLPIVFPYKCSLNNLYDDKPKQAGAELCQAQVKLGLAKLAVNRNKLRAYL